MKVRIINREGERTGERSLETWEDFTREATPSSTWPPDPKRPGWLIKQYQGPWLLGETPWPDELEVPDDTASFLKLVQPLGRFSIDLTTTPITLFFEDGYD